MIASGGVIRSEGRERAGRNWRELLVICTGVASAGLNMVALMWTKPLLNYSLHSGRTRLLPKSTSFLFVAHDQSTSLGLLNSVPLAFFYHRGWFA